MVVVLVDPKQEPSETLHEKALNHAGGIRGVQGLSGFGKGLTPYQCRRLAKAILLPTMLYGAEVFQPPATILSKMETMWRRVQRWITNCFRATETRAWSAEACLMPIELYIIQTQALAAVRWATSDPGNNYTTVLLPSGYPTRSSFRVETVRREAFDKPGGTRPKAWNSTSTTSV